MSYSIKEHFDLLSNSFDQGNWAADESLLASHLQILGLNIKDKCIIDIGCGTGILGSYLKKNGAKITGVDFSPQMIEIASRRLDKTYTIDLSQNQWPLPGDFDVAVCRSIIHYLEPINFLDNIRRLLNANGYLILSGIVPFGDDDRAWFEERINIKKPFKQWIPNENSLLSLLEENGFCIKEKVSSYTYSSLLKTTTRTPFEAERKHALYDHYLNANNNIKTLYNIYETVSGDIIYKCNWLLIKASLK